MNTGDLQSDLKTLFHAREQDVRAPEVLPMYTRRKAQMKRGGYALLTVLVLGVVGATAWAAMERPGAEDAPRPAVSAPDEDALPTTDPSPSPVGLLGEWTTDLPDSVGSAKRCVPGEVCPPPGTWRLTFTEDSINPNPSVGNFPTFPLAEISDPTKARGRFTLGLEKNKGCPGQPGVSDGKGTYRWRIEDGALTLTPVEERCKDMRLILSTSEWTRP
jgi:hypothetical protein